ncbi:MAG TPA: hypothetical protein EYP59_21755 [Thiotrichaceae bacterium]|nr:hypothetical protein [Thiotrichaceae bacterium]
MNKFQDLLLKWMATKKARVEPTANAIGISPLTLKNWRTGKHKPNSPKRVIACANYLRLSREQTHELLKAAGFEPEEDAFIKDIFLELPRHRVMLLLTQANWSEPHYEDISKGLLDGAKSKYGENHILHIKPPANLEENTNTYFSILGEQCQFGISSDASSFEYALEKRLEKEKQLFLLVTRFEQGADAPREQLARIIRSATTNAPHFHVILCGGEKLADLKYQNGAMSLLNHAEVKSCPELSRSEVYILSQRHFGNASFYVLDDTLADNFLDISGGVPKLLTECFKLKQQRPDLPLNSYPDRLSQYQYIYGLFTPLIQEPSNRQKVCQWVQKEELGKAEPYIQDNVLRQLYWKNLLVERKINGEKRLFWRCEAMRKAGNHICCAENNPASPSTNGTSL